jgi:hypothetical protein
MVHTPTADMPSLQGHVTGIKRPTLSAIRTLKAAGLLLKLLIKVSA